ncbi:MAG: winged helix-turn-helix transcriptional regulator [Rhizomicrobium sp.]
MSPDVTDRPRLLDAHDRLILAELARNARLPSQTIANRIGLSRSAVTLRIQRMEQDGTISGYTLKRVPPPRDFISILMIQRRDRLRGSDVLSFLRATAEVRGCWVLSGELDILAIVRAATQERVGEIWRNLARLSGARDTVTAMALETVVALD